MRLRTSLYGLQVLLGAAERRLQIAAGTSVAELLKKELDDSVVELRRFGGGGLLAQADAMLPAAAVDPCPRLAPVF